MPLHMDLLHPSLFRISLLWVTAPLSGGHRSLVCYWIILSSNTNVLLCHPNYTNKSLEPTFSIPCIVLVHPQSFGRLVCTRYLYFCLSFFTCPHTPPKMILLSSHTASLMYSHTFLPSAAFDISDHSILPEMLSFLGSPLVFLLPLWPAFSPF